MCKLEKVSGHFFFFDLLFLYGTCGMDFYFGRVVFYSNWSNPSAKFSHDSLVFDVWKGDEKVKFVL